MICMVVGLSACMQAPDMRTVRAERAQPVHRFDLFQSLASNGKVLVSGAAGGSLLRSVDAGKSWQRSRLSDPAALIAVNACPDGSFVGIDFYKKAWFADAGGENWVSRPLPKDLVPLAVSCDVLNRAWVVGSNATILSSQDKGLNWTVKEMGEDAMLGSVQFVDESHGVVTGEFGTVLTTADGGANWTKQAISRPDFYPYTTLFIDRLHGWSSGVAGVILQTEDGGLTWKTQENKSGAALYSLVAHAGAVYGVGSGGVIATLKNGQWLRLPYEHPAPAFLTSVTSVNPQTLAIAGAAGALQLASAARAAAPMPSSNYK